LTFRFAGEKEKTKRTLDEKGKGGGIEKGKNGGEKPMRSPWEEGLPESGRIGIRGHYYDR